MPSGQRFTVTIHVPGALSADLNMRWTAPTNCTLLHVSAVASNDSAALLTIGDSADPDEYLTSCVIGDSNVPAEYDGDDFVDTSGNTHHLYYPRIVDGTVVCIALDYDGDQSTAAEDVTIVLTLAEG
jgi:hypothetical protein